MRYLTQQRLTKTTQSNLEKFVQINWCGEGVPERQKGHFSMYPHSPLLHRSPSSPRHLRIADLIVPQELAHRHSSPKRSRHHPGSHSQATQRIQRIKVHLCSRSYAFRCETDAKAIHGAQQFLRSTDSGKYTFVPTIKRPISGCD
jgi:hypothetical protein